jgi:hypothetical protein
VEHCRRRALLFLVRGFGRQEHDVEVAEGCHFAATGPAESDECQLGGLLTEDPGAHKIPRQTHELIVQECRRSRGRPAIARFFRQASRNLQPAAGECFPEDSRSLVVEAAPRRKSRKPIGGRATIDDRALLGQAVMSGMRHEPFFARMGGRTTE